MDASADYGPAVHAGMRGMHEGFGTYLTCWCSWSPKDLAGGFKKTLAFQVRAIKQGRGSSGESGGHVEHGGHARYYTAEEFAAGFLKTLAFQTSSSRAGTLQAKASGSSLGNLGHTALNPM